MTRPGGLVQPPGNECTCGNWHSAHTAGSGAAMPWSSRLAHGLVLACGAVSKKKAEMLFTLSFPTGRDYI